MNSYRTESEERYWIARKYWRTVRCARLDWVDRGAPEGLDLFFAPLWQITRKRFSWILIEIVLEKEEKEGTYWELLVVFLTVLNHLSRPLCFGHQKKNGH